MPAWVIRKTLPAYDYGLGPARAHRGDPGGDVSGGDGEGRGSTATYLYWAEPDSHLPHAASWVWLSGLCPQVAFFPTRAEAEAAASTLAGPSWRTPALKIVDLQSAPSAPDGPSTPGHPGLSSATRLEAVHR